MRSPSRRAVLAEELSGAIDETTGELLDLNP
jgi:hypothetical protein